MSVLQKHLDVDYNQHTTTINDREYIVQESLWIHKPLLERLAVDHHEPEKLVEIFKRVLELYLVQVKIKDDILTREMIFEDEQYPQAFKNLKFLGKDMISLIKFIFQINDLIDDKKKDPEKS